MQTVTTFLLEDEDQDHEIMIHPATEHIPGGDIYMTGVFGLSEGAVGLGEIVFDDDMDKWEYTGFGFLTHEQAEEIANFIKNYKDE